MKRRLLGVVLSLAFGASAAEPARAPQPTLESTRQAVMADMQKTLGFAPAFLKGMPDSAMPGIWEQMKALQLSTNTALPPKYKELIGLAVSSQIPCPYCIYAHTEFARANGATDQEIGQAIAAAAVTRQWSTFLNGSRIDEAQFRADVEKMSAYARKMMAPGAKPLPMGEVTDAESAMKDMEQRMGVVPEFMRRFPTVALPGAWKMMRDVELNPAAPMPPKYVRLAGLGVSAQVPCSYCVIADTEAAKAMGATEAELYEALAIASYTRGMSTLINGLQLDEATFKSDIGKLAKPRKPKAAALTP